MKDIFLEILRTMLTIASIIDSQKPKTKLRLHFAVVNNFSTKNMLKIYQLRDKIRNDVEFNFYNAKRVETELKGMHPKGNAIFNRLLPELIPNDIEKLIIFDTGDLMVLRDLSEMYNWDLKNKSYAGVIDPAICKYGRISKKEMNIYINTGSFLINVTKVKKEKMYDKFVKYKNFYYKSIIAEQDLLNDVANEQIGYMPMKFGMISPFTNDYQSDNPPFKTNYKYIEKLKYKDMYPFIPKNQIEMNAQAYNPIVIHQWNGKWMFGNGLSIYRRLAQYYIKLAGIWNEMCKKFPGYCQK